MTPQVPTVVRLAGIPANAISGLQSRPCVTAEDTLRGIEEELESLRQETVEVLYQGIPDAGSEERGFLLAVKRDCFNSRPLAQHTHSRLWAVASTKTSGQVDRIVALERSREHALDDYRRTYIEEKRRASEWLLSFADHPVLLHGLALASPDLVDGLRRWRAGGALKAKRKHRKLEVSFLRLLSRVALKLSPYSKFTQLAIGRLSPMDGDTSVRFVAGERRECASLRVKRYLLDQSCDLLFFYGPLRDYLPVGLNSSIERLGDETYRFLRPFHLEVRPKVEGGERLDYSRPSQVRVRLRGRLVPYLLEMMGHDAVRYRELVRQVNRHFGGDEDFEIQVKEVLSELLEIGFLHVVQPWPGYAPDMERQLLEFLRRVPPGVISSEVAEQLEQIVALEETFVDSTDPLDSIRRLDRLIAGVHQTILRETKPPTGLELRKVQNRSAYEDVFLRSVGTDASVVHLGDRTLRSIAKLADPVWKLGFLMQARHELVLTLEHFFGDRWPARSEVPFLELFAAVRPLWEKYLAHLNAGDQNPFNPLRLGTIEALESMRHAIRQRVAESAVVDGDEEYLPTETLRTIADEIDPRFHPPIPACLYLQPCDPRGSAWVVNRIFEGTGRMSCRFNTVMDPPARRGFIRHFEQRTLVHHDGEELELLDVLYTKGNTVNAHWPQTRRLLLMPGENAEVPANRRRYLTDLVVRRRRGDGRLFLQDQDRQAYLACFLSPLGNPFMPSVVKFLDAFCLGRRESPRFYSEVVRGEGYESLRRLWVGNLVIERRRWTVDLVTLPDLQQREADLFLALNRWRRSFGMPHQVYWIERVNESVLAGEVYKPQYLDFRSPALVSLFAQSLPTVSDPSVTLVEALPRPEDYPKDPSFGPRGLEVMLEGQALEPPQDVSPELLGVSRFQAEDPKLLNRHTVPLEALPTGQGELGQQAKSLIRSSSKGVAHVERRSKDPEGRPEHHR